MAIKKDEKRTLVQNGVKLEVFTGKKKEQFYNLEQLLTYNAVINIIIGERANGKTYAVLSQVIKDFLDNKGSSVYIGRYKDDISPRIINNTFVGMVDRGVISELTKGEFNSVRVWQGKFYLCVTDEDGNRTRDMGVPFMEAVALSEYVRVKRRQFPIVANIVFEEFIVPRGYLPNEFDAFYNMLSTIVRDNSNARVFMIGNTIQKNCIYYKEFGLFNIRNLQKNEIAIYTLKGIKIAVEFSDIKEQNKASKKYFAFDNPKMDMFTGKGTAYALALHPKPPIEFTKKDIVMSFFIEYNDYLIQGDIVQYEHGCFCFFHEKTTPYQNEEKELIYRQAYSTNPLHRRRLTAMTTNFEKKLLDLFNKDLVYYQDNEIGEAVHSYLEWCDTA